MMNSKELMNLNNMLVDLTTKADGGFLKALTCYDDMYDCVHPSWDIFDDYVAFLQEPTYVSPVAPFMADIVAQPYTWLWDPSELRIPANYMDSELCVDPVDVLLANLYLSKVPRHMQFELASGSSTLSCDAVANLFATWRSREATPDEVRDFVSLGAEAVFMVADVATTSWNIVAATNSKIMSLTEWSKYVYSWVLTHAVVQRCSHLDEDGDFNANLMAFGFTLLVKDVLKKRAGGSNNA